MASLQSIMWNYHNIHGGFFFFFFFVWRIFLVLTGVMQEKKQIALPQQRTDTYFTLKLMLIFPPVLRQQVQLFKTANCTSAKSLKCLKQRMWNISVTNGLKSFENTQPLQSNGLNLSSFSTEKRKETKERKGTICTCARPGQVVPARDPLAVFVISRLALRKRKLCHFKTARHFSI